MKNTRSALFASSLCISAFLGCAMDAQDIDEMDPAAELDHEWWDDGPPPGEEAESSDEEVDESELEADVDVETEPQDEEEAEVAFAITAGVFQLPFPCNQVWAGQTRTYHSPRNSIDFNRNNDIGDRVVASAAGRVTVVGNTGSSSYGRWVEIDHGSGYRTRYAHLASQQVRVGQQVRGGEAIGTVGSTGGSTGPHLHFELRRNGVALRPVFNGQSAFYYGTRNYRSRNRCSSSSSSTNGTVRTAGAPLNVRSGPGAGFRVVGSVANGTRVNVRCHKRGSRVTGTYGTTTLWDRIGAGRYVSDAYVYTGTDGRVARWCD